MYNKVILAGNLTRDIELRYSSGGLAIAKTAIATNRKYKGKDGSQADDTCFIDITLFGRAGEVANQYLKKGSKILVEGRLQFEQWTDQTGGKRSKHSVVVESMQMLDSRGASGDDSGYQSYDDASSKNDNYSGSGNDGYSKNSGTSSFAGSGSQNKQSNNIPEIDIDDDEIPF
jgi:single-strand DNA-binding protein